MMFTDIRGFTSLSESKSAAEVVEILNTYFELMVAIITKHNGTINKFIGDAIMVLYGAPVRKDISAKAQAILSVKTAIEMQETIKSSSDQRLKKKPLIRDFLRNFGSFFKSFFCNIAMMAQALHHVRRPENTGHS